MANRALAAKVERARAQRIAAGHDEYSKACWLAPIDKAGMTATVNEALSHGFVITRCPAGRAKGIGSNIRGSRAGGASELIRTLKGCRF